MLSSENSSTPRKAASTSCMTSTAMLSRDSVLPMRCRATSAPKSAMSQAQNMRLPLRPAHNPLSLKSAPRAPVP